MDIKLIKGTFHLGYAYRAGDTASLPDEVANMLINGGYAVPNKPKRREPQAEVIPRAKTRPVSKKK